eukprot:2937566-Amphidinium_carterae.1
MNDAENLSLLFQFGVQLQSTVAFPAACQDTEVATKTFKERCGEVGNRIARFITAGGIGNDGSLHWNKCGCYTIHFENGKGKSVEHISGAIAQGPEHLTITKSFSIISNHLDSLAKVELLPASYVLHHLFDPTVAFKSTMVLDKKGMHVSQMADKTNTEVVAARSAAQVVALPDQKIFEEAKSKKSKKALEQASPEQA